MISVSMSEGLAPSNGAKPHEPARDASRPSKDEKFSSFMDSSDDASEVDPKQEADMASASNTSEPTDKSAPSSEDPTLFETVRAAPETASAEDGKAMIADPDAASSTAPSADKAASDIALKTGEIDSEGSATATDKTKVEAATDTVTTNSTLASEQADAAQATDSDPRLAAAKDTDADIKTGQISESAASGDADAGALKFTDTPDQSSDDGRSRQAPTDAELAANADSRSGDADPKSADRIRTSDLADISAQKQVTASSGDEQLMQVNVAREAGSVTTEPLLAVSSASSSSTAGPVSTGGLAPTIPTHVIAAPNELTSVVMNALKMGGDVQEQLVVQLDPPELGRVMIDFKFDAQGLQQITVTSENPEALKRLRELHFELTEALKSQGFGESNLSFQQEARDQSQNNWQGSDWSRAQSQVVTAASQEVSTSTMPLPSSPQGRERLDLLL